MPIQDITNFIKKNIIAIIIVWILLLFILKIITTRTNHNELFSWYSKQNPIQKEYSCITPWRISMNIEFPKALNFSKPFQNQATPYFLDSLARRYGEQSKMPAPSNLPMTIEDWCIGLGMRLYNWASSYTDNFSAGKDETINLQGEQVKKWALSNMALTVDFATVLDSWTVYQKYGSPTSWQYPQWKGWLACRIRSPAMPTWKPGNSVDNTINMPYDSNTQVPFGDFSWGSPFIQTGYLAPFLCLASNCCSTSGGNTCDCNSPNSCGAVSNEEGKQSCAPSGTCRQNAVSNHQLLPWVEPPDPNFGDLYCSQYASNNPFIAYGIQASSPIILRFLGYGYDDIQNTQAPGGDNTNIVYTGGPASNEYTKISDFLDLVNGGFYKYAESNNKSQTELEDYLFGAYTFESSAQGKIPKKKPPAPCNAGNKAGDTTMGVIGGAGAGAMIGSAFPPFGTVIGGAIGGAVGGWGGYENSSAKCSGGGGTSCSVM